MNSTRNATDNHEQQRMDADDTFQFNCSSGAVCFTRCCQDVTIVLSPYDVLRLKNALGISSDDFLEKHTLILQKKDRLIPMVVLKMNEQDKRCPFVSQDGCTVYNDRPWPCRLFPLDMNDDGTFRIIAKPTLCQGLKENQRSRISDWLIEQGVPIYDEMNANFSQITTPLLSEDLDIDNAQINQMTFMALYNLDKFKEFVFKSTFLDRFHVDDVQLEKLKRNDTELLKFSFDWIKFGLFGQKTLHVKQAP